MKFLALQRRCVVPLDDRRAAELLGDPAKVTHAGALEQAPHLPDRLVIAGGDLGYLMAAAKKDAEALRGLG